MLLLPRRLCWRLPQSCPSGPQLDWRSDLNPVLNVKRHQRHPLWGRRMPRVLQMPDNSPERFRMIEHTMPWEPQLAPHELLVRVRGRPLCETVDESALLTVSPAQKLSTKQMWLVCNTIRYLLQQFKVFISRPAKQGHRKQPRRPVNLVSALTFGDVKKPPCECNPMSSSAC